MSDLYPSVKMVIGLLIAGVAGAISWASYETADGGGTYVVLWGAVAFGGLWFVIGLLQFLSNGGMEAERRQREANEMLMRVINERANDHDHQT